MKLREAAIVALVALLAAGAFALRVHRIKGADGRIGEDAARLVLASRGILETGLPIVPSGRVYWRGAVSSYLTAASIWLLGPGDFAARLPNTVVGALLVPVMFMFGRALGGTFAGLCLAIFAAVQPELIRWSLNAWMTSLFVVVCTTATWLLYLGYEHDRVWAQLAGASAAVVAVLAHELGALLPIAVGMALMLRALRRDFTWFHGTRSVLALAILCLCLVLLLILGLHLRWGTLAGATGEFRHYFGPSLAPNRFLVDYGRWTISDLPLLASVAVGALLLVRAPRSGGLFLYTMLVVTLVTLWIVIDKAEDRYGLILMTLVPLAAVWSLSELARLVSQVLGLTARAGLILHGVLVVAVFAPVLVVDARTSVRWPTPPRTTWLTDVRALGVAPTDLWFTDTPEVVALYMGRVDLWDRTENYERYSYVESGKVRHYYTGALRVTGLDDFEAIARAHPAGTLWYWGIDAYLPSFPPKLRTRFVEMGRVGRWNGARPDEPRILRLDLAAVNALLDAEDRHRPENPSR